MHLVTRAALGLAGKPAGGFRILGNVSVDVGGCMLSRAWREGVPELPRRLSPRAYLRRAGPHFVLEVPFSQTKCIIHDEKCLVWLMEIVRGDASAPLEDAAHTAFYRALALP